MCMIRSYAFIIIDKPVQKALIVEFGNAWCTQSSSVSKETIFKDKYMTQKSQKNKA